MIESANKRVPTMDWKAEQPGSPVRQAGRPLLNWKPITAPRGRAPWWRYSIFPAFLAVNHGPHGDGPRGGPREAGGRVPDGLTECLPVYWV